MGQWILQGHECESERNRLGPEFEHTLPNSIPTLHYKNIHFIIMNLVKSLEMVLNLLAGDSSWIPVEKTRRIKEKAKKKNKTQTKKHTYLS